VIELHNFKKYKVKTVIKLLVRWLNYTVLKYKLKLNPMLEFQRRSSISSCSLPLIFDDIPRVEG